VLGAKTTGYLVVSDVLWSSATVAVEQPSKTTTVPSIATFFKLHLLKQKAPFLRVPSCSSNILPHIYPKCYVIIIFMATTRGSASSYAVGNKPPQVTWTVVRGDTASFRVYVADDNRIALNMPDWSIKMDVKRADTLIMTLLPAQDADDAAGEFTVSLASSESEILETGDIFDIQLTSNVGDTVWTVAQGSMIIVEDVTD
jgi:hypothetical protein